MDKYLLIIVFTLLLGNKIFSQVVSGTTAGQFLKIEVGAKAIAMGGAFVSQANDASALYWNPGSLSKLQNSRVMFTHTFWLADINHDFAGKYVGENIWHMSASTIAFDFGLLYYTPVKNLQLGMSVSNVGGKMKFSGEDNFIYYTYNPDEHGNSDKIYAE